MRAASRPLVSVVLPAWNAAATIGRALASICAQSLRDWELLVVDDGSTDGTAAIVAGWTGREPRVRLITAPRRGLVPALNDGLALAQGEFIARMDADDESHPERLAAQAAFLAEHPAVGVVGCLVEFGGDAGVSRGYALHVEWLNSLRTPEAIALNRFIEAPLAHPSVMFRRELPAMHGGYREGSFPEDYELWLRWFDAGVHMAKVPRVLFTWRDTPGRLSRTDPRYSPEAFYRIKAPWIARAVQRAAPSGREVWVWGAGRPTRQRAAHLVEHGVRLAGYVDIDPRKTGRAVGGVPVVPPAQLPPAERSFVLGYVGTRGARELIREHLGQSGRVEGRDFLMCA